MRAKMARQNSASRAAAPSRERMLQAAKSLFAKEGYENASTSAIAREAGSSESQLVKHFGGKPGLLEAVLDRGWLEIAGQVNQALAFAPTPVAKLGILSHTMITFLDRDPALKQLLLLEGRRVRRLGAKVAISSGFVNFVQWINGILTEMQQCGVLRPEVRPQAVRSALVGMLEGMMRDRMLAKTMGFPAEFSADDVPLLLTLVINGLSAHPTEAPDSPRQIRSANGSVQP